MNIESILAELISERDRLDRAIAALQGDAQLGRAQRSVSVSTTRPNQLPKATPARKRGGLTPEGRKRLSDAMKKRWAERKRKGQKSLS